MYFGINMDNLYEDEEIEIRKITTKTYTDLIESSDVRADAVKYNDIDIDFRIVYSQSSTKKYKYIVECSDNLPIEEILPCIFEYIRSNVDHPICTIATSKDILGKILNTKVESKKSTVRTASYVLSELFKIVRSKRKLLKLMHGFYY